MAWCTAAEVRRVCGYPASGAPVSDTDIEANILEAQAEVEAIANTKFLNIEDSGTATDGGNTTMTDSGGGWTVDQWNDYYALHIYSGTGSGQVRTITDNTATVITVDEAWGTNPDNTSKYRILPNTRIEETIDGTGIDTMYLNYYPLFFLREMTIDSVDITTSNVYQYDLYGKLQLSTDAEDTEFDNSYPQLVELDYYYGYQDLTNATGLPLEVKRLCLVQAALNTLATQIAGTYDDITSFTLPHMSGSLGEPYTNIRQAVMELNKERLELIKIIPKFRSL